MKEEDLPKLFKLFGFLESSKEINTQGIGLGLHITKNIVQQLRGDIVCRSEFGKGTNFTFIIALGRDNTKDDKMKIQRMFNPIKRQYKKLKIPKLTGNYQGDSEEVDMFQYLQNI